MTNPYDLSNLPTVGSINFREREQSRRIERLEDRVEALEREVHKLLRTKGKD